jgi:hypothetical protein
VRVEEHEAKMMALPNPALKVVYGKKLDELKRTRDEIRARRDALAS